MKKPKISETIWWVKAKMDAVQSFPTEENYRRLAFAYAGLYIQRKMMERGCSFNFDSKATMAGRQADCCL